MSTTPAIEAIGLGKHHGGVRAVADLSFAVRPGAVTGFLGPNGAGKSTTLRLLTGLDRPSAGRVLVDGRPLTEWPEPGRKLGAVLGVNCAHRGRTARDSIRWVCRLAGVPVRRGDDLLEELGLFGVADRRTGGFSLGMRQRLALAIALVADPEILVLDEPMNGLDPEGILWTKDLLRRMRAEGRTLFFTTHLLSEVEDLVDDLVVIANGAVVDTGSARSFMDRHDHGAVVVRSDDLPGLAAVLQAAGGRVVRVLDGDRMEVSGLDAAQVGRIAAQAGIPVLELSTGRSLHGAFDAALNPRLAVDGGVR